LFELAEFLDDKKLITKCLINVFTHAKHKHKLFALFAQVGNRLRLAQLAKSSNTTVLTISLNYPHAEVYVLASAQGEGGSRARVRNDA
jgi:hypothetical protein